MQTECKKRGSIKLNALVLTEEKETWEDLGADENTRLDFQTSGRASKHSVLVREEEVNSICQTFRNHHYQTNEVF
jgi:hypothetical protein